MVTIAQCRAARGLAGWTQQDLADAAGLSKTAINNFEKGHSDIKAESLKAIRTAFEARDIEFIGAQGVMLHEETAEILKAPAALPLLFDDILHALQGNGELLIAAPAQNRPWQEQEKLFASHLERIGKDRIRILCGKEELSLWKKFGACAIFSNRHQSGMATFIYGSHLALILWQMENIVLIKSRAAAAAETARFEYLWGSAEEDNGNAPVRNHA